MILLIDGQPNESTQLGGVQLIYIINKIVDIILIHKIVNITLFKKVNIIRETLRDW